MHFLYFLHFCKPLGPLSLKLARLSVCLFVCLFYKKKLVNGVELKLTNKDNNNEYNHEGNHKDSNKDNHNIFSSSRYWCYIPLILRG